MSTAVAPHLKRGFLRGILEIHSTFPVARANTSDAYLMRYFLFGSAYRGNREHCLSVLLVTFRKSIPNICAMHVTRTILFLTQNRTRRKV